MGLGAVTVLGPYACNATGLASAESAIEGAYVGVLDTWSIVTCANGLQFYVMHIENNGFF